MTDQERIADLERRLAEQTRRADVAEAWQKRLTTLLAQGSRNVSGNEGKDFPEKGKDFPDVMPSPVGTGSKT